MGAGTGGIEQNVSGKRAVVCVGNHVRDEKD